MILVYHEINSLRENCERYDFVLCQYDILIKQKAFGLDQNSSL